LCASGQHGLQVEEVVMPRLPHSFRHAGVLWLVVMTIRCEDTLS
jgi:hypothetical protein